MNHILAIMLFFEPYISGANNAKFGLIVQLTEFLSI